jgi:DNA primase large subunit
VNAIRELAAIIAEQAVAADLGRRLLQDAVAAREAQIRRAIKAEKEVDRLTRDGTADAEQLRIERDHSRIAFDAAWEENQQLKARLHIAQAQSQFRLKEFNDLRAFVEVVRIALQEQCWQVTREQIETALVDLDKLSAARKKKDEVTT